MPRLLRLALFAFPMALAACAPREVPPVLTVAAPVCPATPDLAAAQPSGFDGMVEVSATYIIPPDAPCWSDAEGRKSLYALIALPEVTAPYTARLSSHASGRSVFAPHVRLLDAHGAVVRDIPPSNLLFRGGSLSGLFRIQPGERYLLAASNPAAVGGDFSRTVLAMDASTAAYGGGSVTIYTGSDTTLDYVYSHAGTVQLTLRPLAEAVQ